MQFVTDLELYPMTKGIIEHKHSSHFNVGQDVSICGSSSAVTNLAKCDSNKK